MSWDEFFSDLENEVDDWEKESLISSLERVALNEWDIRAIYNECFEPMTRDRYDELREHIRRNTPCPIMCGWNYNQGDIARKLKREI